MVNQHKVCALLRWLISESDSIAYPVRKKDLRETWRLVRRRVHRISASLLFAGFVCENAEKCESARGLVRDGIGQGDRAD